MRVPSREGRGTRFTAAGKRRRSVGTHVESAKRSRSCVKCLDITVLFRPVRSSPFSPASLQFHPFYPPTGRADRPACNPFSRRALVPARADLMTLPRHDFTMIQLSMANENETSASFLPGAFPLRSTLRTIYWFNCGKCIYGEYKQASSSLKCRKISCICLIKIIIMNIDSYN